MASNKPADTLPSIKCVQCGFENRLGTKFCARCGAPLPTDEIARMPAPPQLAPVPPQPAQRRTSRCAPIALVGIVGIVMICVCLVLVLGVATNSGVLRIALGASPTPTATATPTFTSTPTPTYTATATATRSPTLTRTPTTAPTANPTTAPIPIPTTTILANLDDPNHATLIDGNPHVLAARSAMWYRFNYGGSDTGERPVRTVTLVNGNNSGIRFEVWTPDNLNNWWEKQPIGRGTQYSVDCDTGEASDQGECRSNDLTWMGAFNFNDSIYVRVVNDNDHPTVFQLTLQ